MSVVVVGGLVVWNYKENVTVINIFMERAKRCRERQDVDGVRIKSKKCSLSGCEREREFSTKVVNLSILIVCCYSPLLHYSYSIVVVVVYSAQ
jgi:hypothetical protein